MRRLEFFIAFLCIGTASCLIEPITLPVSLDNCINSKVEQNNGSGVHLHHIQNMCLGKYVLYETPHNWARNLTSEEEAYVQSLLYTVIAEAESAINPGSRSKRSAQVEKRFRREIRAGGSKHFDAYAKAVQRIKFKEIGANGRSRYDTLADIHMTSINSAHFGPNFLAWHRLYLLLYETALGVAIPYWDSTIDYEMADPTQSIVWTGKYFGNGYGMVKTGPFANFQTPSGPLIRNIGSDGSLFNKREIKRIFTRSRLYKILEPTADERVSIEGQHNSVHNWVDGQMNTQEFSPHDPLFWTHHAFVDYLWEEFRKVQIARGIDPKIDIPEPPENVTFQGANDPAVGLLGFYNRDGYSDRIAHMVKYDPHPECPKCGLSEDLICNFTLGHCISARRKQTEYAGNRAEAQEIADRMIEESTGRSRGNVFDEYNRDDRVRGDSLTIRKEEKFSKYSLALGGAKKSSYFSNSNPIYSFGEEMKDFSHKESFPFIPNEFSPKPIHFNGLPQPFKNPYVPVVLPMHVLQGPTHLQSNRVFPGPFYPQPKPMPVFNPYPKYNTDLRTVRDFHFMRGHVIKRRSLSRRNIDNEVGIVTPWSPSLENTFFLDGKIDVDMWAFVPIKIVFQNKTRFIGSNSRTSTDLEIILGNNNSMCNADVQKVYVQSHGLDYYGKYKDFSISVNGEPVTNFVAIKKPINGAVETYLSVYNSCGNVCSSRCLVPGIYPRVYKTCTGAVRASAEEPLMYINDVNRLSISETEVPMIFVCNL